MNFILGQFYSTNSIIERVDARSKILCTLLYIAAVFLCSSYVEYTICGAFMILTILLSRIPFTMVFKGVKSMLFILIFTAVMNLIFNHNGNVIFDFWVFSFTDVAVNNTIKICLRLIFVVMFSSILTLSTKPVSLTSAIEDLLSPLKVFNVPISELAMIMGIALRFIPTLADEMVKIKKAQEARGAKFDDGSLIKRVKSLIPIVIPLFVSSFRRADELAMAMESRCYSSGIKRTRLNKPKFDGKAVFSLAVFACLVVLIMVLRYAL